MGSLLFSFLLWRSTDKLWSETKRLAGGAEDQHETLKASVEVARSAAEAAHASAALGREAVESSKSSIALAKQSSEYQLRAYLGYIGGLVVNLNGPQTTVIFDLKNFGQTPAFHTKVRTLVYCANKPLEDNIAYDFASDLGVTDPRHTQNVRLLLNTDSKHILSMSAGQIFMLAGRIEYTDIFGVERWRQFGTQIAAPDMQFVSPVKLSSTPGTDKGN